MMLAGKRAEWRAGWTVVVAAMFGVSLNSMVFYSIGLFIAPIERELHWSRTFITAGTTLISLVGIASAPLVGILIDRVGARRIALPGSVILCCGVGSLGFMGTGTGQWWASWAFIALGVVLVTPTAWATAVASRFAHGRGLALALALCGGGLGAAVAPLLGNALIDAYGWRAGYLGLALAWAVVSLPVIFVFFRSGADPERRPATAPDAGGPTGMIVREAIRSPAYARLAIGALLLTTVMLGMSAHFVPIVSALADRSTAAAGASVIGLASIVGRLATGSFLDRYPGNRVGAVAFALPALASAALLGCGGSTVGVMIVAILLGLGLGAEIDITAYLASRYFGMRHFGTLFGSLTGLMSLGVAIGPLAAARVYDVTGGYGPALWAVIPIALVGAGAVLTLGPCPPGTVAPAGSPT